jgi:xanthine/uracil permease
VSLPKQTLNRSTNSTEAAKKEGALSLNGGGPAGLYEPWVRKFEQLVSGSLITLLGLSLMGVAINWVGGGQPTVDRFVNGVSVISANPAYGSPQRLGLAILVPVLILSLRKFGRGMWQSLATLVGIIIGTTVAIPL